MKKLLGLSVLAIAVPTVAGIASVATGVKNDDEDIICYQGDTCNFDSGIGTEASPWVIKTYEQFISISDVEPSFMENETQLHYKLGADIVAPRKHKVLDGLYYGSLSGKNDTGAYKISLPYGIETQSLDEAYAEHVSNAMFTRIEDSAISDVIIDVNYGDGIVAPETYKELWVASLSASASNSKFERIATTLKNLTVTIPNTQDDYVTEGIVAGLIGYATDTSFVDVNVAGNMTFNSLAEGAYFQIGGVFGVNNQLSRATQRSLLEKVSYRGNITSNFQNLDGFNELYIGGIGANLDFKEASQVGNIKNLHTDGTINVFTKTYGAEVRAGGAFGFISGYNNKLINAVSNMNINAKFETTGRYDAYFGGIAALSTNIYFERNAYTGAVAFDNSLAINEYTTAISSIASNYYGGAAAEINDVQLGNYTLNYYAFCENQDMTGCVDFEYVGPGIQKSASDFTQAFWSSIGVSQDWMFKQSLDGIMSLPVQIHTYGTDYPETPGDTPSIPDTEQPSPSSPTTSGTTTPGTDGLKFNILWFVPAFAAMGAWIVFIVKKRKDKKESN